MYTNTDPHAHELGNAQKPYPAQHVATIHRHAELNQLRQVNYAKYVMLFWAKKKRKKLKKQKNTLEGN